MREIFPACHPPWGDEIKWHLDVRDMKIATHAEIKMLGWVLGKLDKDVVKDIADHSNRVIFPGQLPI